MSKGIADQADKKNPTVNNSEDTPEKTALISEIMKRVDSLEPDEIKLINQLALRMKSTKNDSK